MFEPYSQALYADRLAMQDDSILHGCGAVML